MFWVFAGIAIGGLLLAAMSRRWCLPLAASAWLIAVASFLVFAAMWATDFSTLVHPALSMLVAMTLQLIAYLLLLAWRFYRDPERRPPADTSIILSPADGKVIYIRRIPPGSLLTCDKNGAKMQLDELASSTVVSEELWQIGISMVFTDVHVNRAPIGGTVTLVQHRPGRFLSLRTTAALNVNERQTLVIDNGQFQIALVQIASRLVRQIESYVTGGQRIERAQRIGMIKFGSQVDVFLPTRVASAISVSVGTVLVAGESELAVSRSQT